MEILAKLLFFFIILFRKIPDLDLHILLKDETESESQFQISVSFRSEKKWICLCSPLPQELFKWILISRIDFVCQSVGHWGGCAPPTLRCQNLSIWRGREVLNLKFYNVVEVSSWSILKKILINTEDWKPIDRNLCLMRSWREKNLLHQYNWSCSQKKWTNWKGNLMNYISIFHQNTFWFLWDFSEVLSVSYCMHELSEIPCNLKSRKCQNI